MRCLELLRLLEHDRAEAREALSHAYRTGARARLEDRRQAWARVARRFLERWGDREVLAVRAPARIALNPHCEHQGAWVPYGTHSRELLCLAGARSDDTVTLTNLDPTHRGDLSFRVQEEVSVAPEAWRRGWLDYLETPEVARRREALADPRERREDRTGSINFIKAAALRLGLEAPRAMTGADLVIEGDIQVGVGQSSSSTLVVASALVFHRLWHLPHDPAALSSLCGEAEWYVGTRGGAGDHAAMLLSSAEGLMGIRFVPPVTVRETRPLVLPPGYQMLIANSCHRAIKNKEERRLFNAGIFAYRFALLYLREAVAAHHRELGLSPEENEVRFLGDVSVEHFSLETIYRLLLAVPETVSPQELRERYPESYGSSALACFGTAACEELPQDIPVRGAALYGLGRVDRGLAMHELCEQGDEAAMAEFGHLMYLTHDGDRVTRYDPQANRSHAYDANRRATSDRHLAHLAKLAARMPRRAGGRRPYLRHQSGFYGASIPELDRMVDAVSPLPGVLGAGLMGAGGGGCILLLTRAEESTTAAVVAALDQHYYQPLGKPREVEPWVPSPPAGEIDFLRPARAPRPSREVPGRTPAQPT